MATENNTEGFSPLDPLGPSMGSLNLPTTPQSMLPFEGDRIQMPEINFPKPDSFQPVLPQFDKLNQEQLNVKRNIVGDSPTRPGTPPKGTSTADIISGLSSYVSASLKANQDKNSYARIYQYDSSSKGNAFYDRYMAYGQEKFDKIGFTPLRDNESIFNESTTGWDDFKRMMTYSFVPLVTHGFISGPKSLIMAAKGDFGADLEEARAYEEATAIGYSSKGGIGSFMNNTLMNFGYTAGIMGEVLAEEAVLGAITAMSGGLTAGVAASRTAGNLARLGKGFAQTFYMDRFAAAAGKALTSLKNTQAARSFWKAANTPAGRFFNPLTNTFEAVSNVSKISKFDNLTGLAKLSKTAGGFYADVRRLNAAFSEGRLEGGLVENQMYDKLYNEYYERNGKAPTDQEDYQMRKKAKEASMDTIAWNTGLVYLSNGITFNNILTPKGGARRFLAGKTEELMRTAEGRIVGEITQEAGKKSIKVNTKYIQNSFKDSWKAFKAAPVKTSLKAAGTYTKANFMEGIQENVQEAISQTMENYYIDMYNSEAVRGHLFARAAQTEGMRSQFSYFSDAWSEQNPFTEKGFETFATGFVMGLFGGGLNMVPGFVSKGYNKMFKPEEYQKMLDAKNAYGERLANTLNTQIFNDPFKVFSSKLFNLGLQDNAGRVKLTGSRLTALDASNDAMTSAIVTALNTNSLDLLKQQIASYKDLSVTEFEEAAKIEKGQGEKYQGKIDSILQRIDEIEADYKEYNDRYPDPIDIAGYKKGTDAYNKAAIYLSAWRSSRDNAIFLGQTFKNAKERRDAMRNLLGTNKPLSKMTDTELMVLLDTDRLPSEIGILQSEIEAGQGILKPAELKKKQRVLDALKNFKSKVDYYYNYDNAELEATIANLREQGRFKNVTDDEGNILSEEDAEETFRDMLRKRLNVREKTDQNTTRAESDLEVAYKDYLKAIADVKNDEYLDRNADAAFEYILDNYRLGRDASILNKHVNLLYDPNEFMEHVERNYEWMSRMYENKKEYYQGLVNQEMNNIILNALLNELANRNVYISADDAVEFQRNGTIPSEFYDDNRKIVIKEGSLEYDEYINIFQQAARLANLNPNSKKNANEKLSLELSQLYAKEQAELDALPQKEELKEKADLNLLGKPSVRLSEVIDQLNDGDTLSAFYMYNGQPVEVQFYKDGDQIKEKNKKGAVVDVAAISFDLVDGKIFSLVSVPADSIAAQKIKDAYAKKREDAIRAAIGEVEASGIQVGKEFIPFTVNTPLDDMDTELYNTLLDAFNKDIEDKGLLDEYANLDTFALREKLQEFVSTSPEAKQIIDEYNSKKSAEQLEENASQITAPIIRYNNQDLDLETISLEEAKKVLADLEKQYAARKKENLSPEETEDLLLEELNLTAIRKYIKDVEELNKTEDSAEEKASTDMQKLAAETARKRELATQALQRRIALVEERRKLAEKEEAEITDTLEYLQQLLDNTVELTGIQVEDLLNKIEQLDKTTAQLLKSKQKKRGVKIQDRTQNYKQQLRREFALANDILNRIKELKEQRDQLSQIKNDLKKQADYYRNLIADPNFSLFDKTDIRNKIRKIEKKMNTIQKLIQILKDAISRSMEYLKEYLNIWKKHDRALSKLKNSGYKELSNYTLTQLRGTGDTRLDEYAQNRAEFQRLEREINQAMDNVEFIDAVREQENERMLELEASLQKYQDQIRYLYDLLEPVAEEIVTQPMDNGGYSTPAPSIPKVYDVDPIDEADEKVTILSTFSLADIADLENPLTSEKVGRPLTEQEKKLQSVREIIKEVLGNASFIKLSEDGSKYINTKTGKEYQRVTSYTKEDDIKDPKLDSESMEDYKKRLTDLGYSEKDVNQKMLLASSQVIGTKIDDFIRDFFSGKVKDVTKYNFAPVEEIEKLKENLQKIKDSLDAKGEIVLANNVVLYNDEIGVAGTVDLLTFDTQGNIRIYDIKTSRGNPFVETYANDPFVKYETKSFGGKSKRQQHTEQLSLYRILLNNTHGLKARQIAILPIALDYASGDTSTNNIEVLPGVELIPQDTVGKSAVLVEQKSSAQQVQTTTQPSGIKVATDIQPELRSMLNSIGYSNSTINMLPKSEIEYIIKNGIPREQYASRIVTEVISDSNGMFWAIPGDAVVIKTINDKGVQVARVNSNSSIFISFNQLKNQTRMSTDITPKAAPVETTTEVKETLQQSSDLVKEVLDKEINNLDDRVKSSNVEELENTLFNTKIC